MAAAVNLPHKVKTQYLQIQNIIMIIDTSIEHQISGQSTSIVKGCMLFDIVDTLF